MVIFNSYVTNYQRVVEFLHFCSPKIGWPDCHGSPRRDPALDGSNVSSPGIVIWIPNGHWSWLRNHQSCLSFQGVSIYIYMDIWIYIHISIYIYMLTPWKERQDWWFLNQLQCPLGIHMTIPGLDTLDPSKAGSLLGEPWQSGHPIFGEQKWRNSTTLW